MNLHEPIIIDGGYGEGGGQVVRTSLSLAMITGRPVRLVNIRGGRRKPGLRPQHLTAVQACVAVSDARVEGAELGSQELSLFPSTVRAGTYHFNIGTAGAVTLVVQTVLPALALAEGKTFLTVRGGTHVPWSPPFQYFAEVFLPTIRQLGTQCEASIPRWGWYPKGGGEIQARIRGHSSSAGGLVDQPFQLQRITGLSASSRLPEHIGVRQQRQLQKRLRPVGVGLEIGLMDIPAINPGSFVFVCAQGKEGMAGFSSLGAKGKPAEQVADETADALLHFLDSNATLDPHLADQILIYLAGRPGESRFTTSKLTRHLLTNAWVIEQFLPVKFEIVGSVDEPGVVIKHDQQGN